MLWNLHAQETLHSSLPAQLLLYGFHHFCRIGSWKVSSTNGTFEDGVTAEDGIFYNQAAASNGMARGYAKRERSNYQPESYRRHDTIHPVQMHRIVVRQ